MSECAELYKGVLLYQAITISALVLRMLSMLSLSLRMKFLMDIIGESAHLIMSYLFVLLPILLGFTIVFQ